MEVLNLLFQFYASFCLDLFSFLAEDDVKALKRELQITPE